jgi:hypothetical protein
MSKKNVINYEYILGYADGLSSLLRELQAQNSYVSKEQHEATKDIMAVVKAFASAANYTVGAARSTVRAEERVR